MSDVKIPERIAKPDWSAVRAAVEEYAAFLVSDEDYYEDGHGNYEHEIVEQVLMAIYGDDVFDTFVNPAIDAQDKRIYGEV